MHAIGRLYDTILDNATKRATTIIPSFLIYDFSIIIQK